MSATPVPPEPSPDAPVAADHDVEVDLAAFLPEGSSLGEPEPEGVGVDGAVDGVDGDVDGRDPADLAGWEGDEGDDVMDELAELADEGDDAGGDVAPADAEGGAPDVAGPVGGADGEAAGASGPVADADGEAAGAVGPLADADGEGGAPGAPVADAWPEVAPGTWPDAAIEAELGELGAVDGPAGAGDADEPAAHAGNEELDEGDVVGVVSEADVDLPEERQDPPVDLAALGQIEADLGAVDAALLALDQGRYGTCAACDQPIDDDLLAADPVRTTCPVHTAA